MKIEIEKDWCLDAAKREDGQEVGAGTLDDALGPIMVLRLKLTETQKKVERMKSVVSGQAYDIENRIQEFGIMSAEIGSLNAALREQQSEIAKLQAENDDLQKDLLQK